MPRTAPAISSTLGVPPVLDAALRERESLENRRQVLEQARGELQAILAEADARIAVAEAERDRIAAERGGRAITLGAVSARRGRQTQWSFSGQPQPPDVRHAVAVVAALETEAAPLVSALARVDGELAEVAAQVEQTDQRIAVLREDQDREEAASHARAELIGGRLDWSARARAVLERLG
jgi:hypothetical protein